MKSVEVGYSDFCHYVDKLFFRRRRRNPQPVIATLDLFWKDAILARYGELQTRQAALRLLITALREYDIWFNLRKAHTAGLPFDIPRAD